MFDLLRDGRARQGASEFAFELFDFPKIAMRTVAEAEGFLPQWVERVAQLWIPSVAVDFVEELPGEGSLEGCLVEKFRIARFER